MDKLPQALVALAEYDQFIIWKPVPNGNKITKKPLNPYTGIVHDPHDSTVWMRAADAFEALKNFPANYGIGFVFAESDPFFFNDLDDCLQADGTWSQVALNICTKFTGCGVEVSQSGTGLHIFGKGIPPPHGCKNQALGLELYHTKRFAALTGIGTTGDAGALTPIGALDWLVDTYFKPGPVIDTAAEWTTTPDAAWSGPIDDDELIKKMFASKSPAAAFGGKASIEQLWTADPEVLGTFYPEVGDKSRGFGWSEAEGALCAHLAWWTGKDCERIDRLMRRSGLYRDKWETRKEYREGTVLKAVGMCRGVYGDRPKIDAVKPIETTAKQFEVVEKSGYQYLSPDKQIEYFKDCIYVQSHQSILTPTGILLNPEKFKATYGGYVFALDSSNDKTTRNAWEVFTQSQAVKFPKANDIAFRPSEPPFCVIEREGLIMVNSYIPINITRAPGDISPFLNLVGKLFPIQSDREIILGYMAACVQYPGKKFQWAPLIQGCEGNGKSFLITAVSNAIGVRYTHKPPAKDISNVFNAWIMGKIFIAVEEVYVNDNREVMDALKILITDSRVPVTPKGVDQMTGDNCANFMCTSNHKNAIRIALRNNRRWCIFYTPQQSYDDIIRDGMSGRYFPDLYNWLDGEGQTIINDFLMSYPIPDDVNPATLCHRAPMTTSSAEVVTASLGGIEQDIIEAVGEGRVGFAGGWISSIALGKLLEKRRITHHKRAEILKELGYIQHPGLKGGRVNTLIPIDGGKPRLYIKSDHPHALLTQSIEIVKNYINDQGVLT